VYPENRVHCLGFYQTSFPECRAGSRFGACGGKTTRSWMQHSAIYVVMPVSGAGGLSEYLEELLSSSVFFLSFFF